MKETIWMHSLDHDIRLRKAITAFEDWAGFDHPDPGNFKWDTSARLRDSLRLHWPDGEETEEWLTSLMQRVLDWQRSTDAGNRTEWLLDGRGMTETDLRDLFAQQVHDQPEAYWGEGEWTEADNEDIEREYEVWVEIHMRDGMLRSAADMEPDELERLIVDRDEEDKPTEETLGLLDAWLGNPGGEDPRRPRPPPVRPHRRPSRPAGRTRPRRGIRGGRADKHMARPLGPPLQPHGDIRRDSRLHGQNHRRIKNTRPPQVRGGRTPDRHPQDPRPRRETCIFWER